MEPEPGEFTKFELVCRLLLKHRVDFVVIGGVAAILSGSPSLTEDLDIVPRAADNLDRLSAALVEIHAEVDVCATSVTATG